MTTEQRFWAKVDKNGPGGCWLWTAARYPGGYGQFRANGKGGAAHRFAYELLVGPIPEGLEVDHVCHVRHCVNPGHLQAVTRSVNMTRAALRRRSRREQAQATRRPEADPGVLLEVLREAGVSLSTGELLHRVQEQTGELRMTLYAWIGIHASGGKVVPARPGVWCLPEVV